MPIDVMSWDELHYQIDECARTYLDIQKLRIQISNRHVAATKRQGLATWSEQSVTAMQSLEHQLDLELTRLMKQHFMAEWIQTQCKGVGLPTIGRLLGCTGALNNFATVSKLWKYCGFAVNERGETQKRRKGERIDYSPQARVILHQMGESIIRVGHGGRYRAAYDRKRAEYFGRKRVGDSGCPMGYRHVDRNDKVIQCVKTDTDGMESSAHLHAAAMRYTIKRFLADFWEEWHRTERGLVPVHPMSAMPS